MLQVKVKKFHPNAVIPKYAKKGDAGLDLTAVSKKFDKDGNIVYDIGLGFEIPDGYMGLLFPRSSNAKKDLILTNSVGVIDSGFRGSVAMKYKPSGVFADYNGEKTSEEFENSFDFVDFPKGEENDLDLILYEVGERVGQIIIIPYPQIQLIESEELSKSERGENGYGSTGTK